MTETVYSQHFLASSSSTCIYTLHACLARVYCFASMCARYNSLYTCRYVYLSDVRRVLCLVTEEGHAIVEWAKLSAIFLFMELVH